MSLRTLTRALAAWLFLLPTTELSAQDLDIESIHTHQLVDLHDDGSQTITDVGRFDIVYTPPAETLVLNIIATDNPSSPDNFEWIARNILIPDSSYHNESQMLSVTFDLGLIGIDTGEIAEFFLYQTHVGRSFLDSAPDPSLTDISEAIVTTADIRLGGGLPVENLVDLPSSDFSYEIPVPYDLDRDSLDVVYEGCRIPNHDLDSSTNPADYNGCGPASLANSLKWLDDMHDDIELPEHADLYDIVNDFCNRPDGQGVGISPFLYAKMALIEAYNLPLCVTFQMIDPDTDYDVEVPSTTGQDTAKRENTEEAPTFDWMLEKLRDDCDVELWVKGPRGKVHVVTLSGGSRLSNGASTRYRIRYKHDADQTDSGGQVQERGVVDIDSFGLINDVMVIRNFFPDGSDGAVVGATAECYCEEKEPQPRMATLEFGDYCSYQRIVLPPNSSVTFSFDGDPMDSLGFRSYAAQLYELTYPFASVGETQLVERWADNVGQEREYRNESDHPVSLSIHNDDNGPFSELGWTFDYEIEPINRADEKHDRNVARGAASPDFVGFSMGWRDGSNDEFGDIDVASATVVGDTGLLLGDVPRRIGISGVRALTLTHEVDVWNDGWSNLELRLGIDTVPSAGDVHVYSDATGLDTTIRIEKSGEVRFGIGGMTETGTFDLHLDAINQTVFDVDYYGVPYLIDTSTSGVDSDSDAVGFSVVLEPNPSVSYMRARIALPATEWIKVAVHDALGRQVTVLFEGVHPSGQYVIPFAPSDWNVAAGKYFVDVQRPNGTVVASDFLIISD